MFTPTIKQVIDLFARPKKINYTKAKLKQAIMYFENARNRHIHLSSDQKIDLLKLLKELDELTDE